MLVFPSTGYSTVLSLVSSVSGGGVLVGPSLGRGGGSRGRDIEDQARGAGDVTPGTVKADNAQHSEAKKGETKCNIVMRRAGI